MKTVSKSDVIEEVAAKTRAPGGRSAGRGGPVLTSSRGQLSMHVIATIPVDVHIARPDPGDQRLGEADALVNDQRATVVLTPRGLYLMIDRSELSWGIDLNRLARGMADAVAPPTRAEGGRHG